MIKQLFKSTCIVGLLVGILVGCSGSGEKEVQTLSGYALGTSYSIKLVSDLSESQSLQLGIEGVLSDINNRMSTYLPKSDISRFTEQKINSALSVDEKTAYVVEKALEIAQQTNGSFDPTVAPLVDLWGFGPTPRNNVVPDEEEVKRNLQHVGYQAVQVDLDNSTLLKTAPRELDLSAIAKGYAVDQVALFIESKGYSNYLVEVGGEMRFSGTKPNDKPWRIAIEKPVVSQRSPYRILDVGDIAIATSGDYRNFFEIDGKRYSHTIDPQTGYPIEHDVASVTVAMESCMAADAFATAFDVMGKEKALALAEQLGIAVFMIYRKDDDFLSVQSSKFTEQFGDLAL